MHPLWRTTAIRVALGVDATIQAVVLLALRLHGRPRPMVVPFIGHGTPQRIRVGGRVVMGHPDAAAPTPTPGPRSRRAVLRSTVARFLTVEVARAEVTVWTPGGAEPAHTDDEGYLDAAVSVPGLDPGWHDVDLVLAGAAAARARVLVVDPDARIGLVSDVDDTIVETGLGRGWAFLRATLLTDVGERTPLPGAAALYRAFVAAPGPARPVFYLSTSPWNLHEMLLDFIALRRFPLGPLLLTDWGPTRSGLFRIGAQEHKVGVVHRLLDEHPNLGLVLVGDSGQSDPEIYALLAREHPDRIRAVYIRRTVLATPRRLAEVDALATAVSEAGVPMLAVDDSVEIAVHAAALGLLDPAAPAEVLAGG